MFEDLSVAFMTKPLHQHENHEHRTSGQVQAANAIERACDVAVIGGSAAGLAAALQLGRQRRSVIIVDAGEPRNAPAAHMHSYLGHEGIAPGEFLEIGRCEVRSYGVEVLAGRALNVAHTGDGRFRVELAGGNTVLARRIVLASGLVDMLPDIDGVREHWGGDVIHCPFCHGYEVRDQRIVAIVTSPVGLHSAGLFRQLTDRLTIVIHSGVGSDQPEVDALRDAGITVVAGPVERLVSGGDGRLAAVEVTGADRIAADAVVVGTRFDVRADAVASLGVATVAHMTGLGDVIDVDATGATSVPGVWAAGNVTDPSQQVLQAAASGSWVGGMISADLVRTDMAEAARPSAHQDDWDARYSGDMIWSGNPNGTLVSEVASLQAGRALDIGAGEGGDAVWLAEQGWAVTAADISERALERIAAVANDCGLDIVGLHADASALEPFEPAAFDLVTAHYASIHRSPDSRVIDNILLAVAPGGTLLVVGHDPDPMKSPIDVSQQSRAFDPDAYVGIDDIAEAINARPDWTISVHAKRSRPAGAASTHRVDDVVLRARNLGVSMPT